MLGYRFRVTGYREKIQKLLLLVVLRWRVARCFLALLVQVFDYFQHVVVRQCAFKHAGRAKENFYGELDEEFAG